MTDPNGTFPPRAAERQSLAAHGAGFAVSGAVAFTVDAIVLLLLTKGLGIGPFVARIAAISLAMVAGWQCHRRLTFRVSEPSSLKEFLAYAGVAWASAAINYAAYAAILLARPETEPVAALVGASLVAMGVAYAGMRFGVFRGARRS